MQVPGAACLPEPWRLGPPSPLQGREAGGGYREPGAMITNPSGRGGSNPCTPEGTWISLAESLGSLEVVLCRVRRRPLLVSFSTIDRNKGAGRWCSLLWRPEIVT